MAVDVKVRTFSSPESWHDAAAELLLTACKAEVAPHVALGGGTTPVSLYRHLAGLPCPHPKLRFWVGDERCVPADHPDRNEKMIRTTLLAGEGTMRTSPLLGWPDHLEPAASASLFATALDAAFAGRKATFALALLGLGTDGHTASLFPESSALCEMRESAVATWVDKLQQWRLTITRPVLERSRSLCFLVRGEEKASIIERIVARDRALPAATLEVGQQQILWLR